MALAIAAAILACFLTAAIPTGARLFEGFRDDPVAGTEELAVMTLVVDVTSSIELKPSSDSSVLISEGLSVVRPIRLQLAGRCRQNRNRSRI